MADEELPDRAPAPDAEPAPAETGPSIEEIMAGAILVLFVTRAGLGAKELSIGPHSPVLV